MAKTNKRIDQLPGNANALKGTDVIPIFSDGKTERNTLDEIASFIVSGTTNSFLTGGTLSGVLTLGRNQGLSDITIDLFNTSPVNIVDLSGGTTTNTFVGYQTGVNNTTGVDNTFLGDDAGESNTYAYSVVAIGSGALNSNTGAEENVAIGKDAMRNTTTTSAYNNTSIGHESLMNNNACCSVAIGSRALKLNTTGTENVGVGNSVMSSNLTGRYNTGVGSRALYLLKNGNDNSALGRYSSYSLTGGTNNLTAGFQAGYSSIDGDNNVFLGYKAGYSELGSNRLYISNSNTSTPLVWGNFTNNTLVLGGLSNTSVSADTVYVPNLNVGTVGGGTSIHNLGIDSGGNVVSGTSSILTTNVTLNNTQTLTLNSSPVTLVAAPGVGKAIDVISATMVYTFDTTPFATNTTMCVCADTLSDYQWNADISDTSSKILRLEANTSGSATTLADNKGMVVKVVSGNPTGGGASSLIKIDIAYRIITL